MISCIFLERLLKVPPNGNGEFLEEWVINWGFTKLLVRDECWYWLFKKISEYWRRMTFLLEWVL